MEHSFTPGPWFAVNDGTDDEPMMMVKAARIAGKPPRHEVAIVATGDSPQTMENANARLIAAAPDMLAALQCMLGHATGNMDGDMELSDDPLGMARAALSKATS